MKLEYVSNPTLLTSIKRSHSRLSKRMRTEKVVTTNLFVFEYVECSKIEAFVNPVHVQLWNFCLKVTEAATGEKFVVTQKMWFREDDWTLFKEVK